MRNKDYILQHDYARIIYYSMSLGVAISNEAGTGRSCVEGTKAKQGPSLGLVHGPGRSLLRVASDRRAAGAPQLSKPTEKQEVASIRAKSLKFAQDRRVHQAPGLPCCPPGSVRGKVSSALGMYSNDEFVSYQGVLMVTVS